MPWTNDEVLAFLNERGVGIPVAHPGEPYCFLCASHLTDPGTAGRYLEDLDAPHGTAALTFVNEMVGTFEVDVAGSLALLQCKTCEAHPELLERPFSAPSSIQRLIEIAAHFRRRGAPKPRLYSWVRPMAGLPDHPPGFEAWRQELLVVRYDDDWLPAPFEFDWILPCPGDDRLLIVLRSRWFCAGRAAYVEETVDHDDAEAEMCSGTPPSLNCAVRDIQSGQLDELGDVYRLLRWVESGDAPERPGKGAPDAWVLPRSRRGRKPFLISGLDREETRRICRRVVELRDRGMSRALVAKQLGVDANEDHVKRWEVWGRSEYADDKAP